MGNTGAGKEYLRRSVWCLLGIPVDVVSFDEAVAHVESCVLQKKRCFFSTPNLNFFVQARKVSVFRRSVIESDLVLVDGMLPFWVARFLGIPGIEKVSGSDLFDFLMYREPGGKKRIRVFLFGGEAGIGEIACERINSLGLSLECVGYLNPGFVSVEEMSSERIINEVNESNADFVVVSLGARKGQEWIMANKDKLNASVVSHLGAVINFVAGNVERAPRWLQGLGIEWLWRISQEPALWRRYFSDGLVFLSLIIGRVLPYACWRLLHRSELATSEKVECRLVVEDSNATIILEGPCIWKSLAPLHDILETVPEDSARVVLDLGRVEVVDAAFLGLCLLLQNRLDRDARSLVITGCNPTVRNIFHWNMAEFLL